MRTILALFTFYLSFAFVLFGANAVGIGANAPDSLDRRAFTSIDDYIPFMKTKSKQGILDNIGPSGAKASGAGSGVVIAGPSKSDPDYFYTWIRDSALVYKHLIDVYVSGRDNSLLAGINNWIASMKRIQQVSNPSGSVSTGGLGEPKFLVTEAAFTGGWGRPQRDGPALRATSLIRFANKLIGDGSAASVKTDIWPLVLLDLNYVSDVWNFTGYDLWEEVNGASFFTTAVQHRALREGATFATALGETASATKWLAQADNVLCFLQSYWSNSGGFIVANVNPGSGAIRSGKDSNTVLTSVHTYDPAAGCDATTFQPCSDKALASLKVYVDSFRNGGGGYTINNGIPASSAVAVGRYFEDTYYGGNPWYLCTFAVAEQLYRALQTWESQGHLDVTSISLPFFQQFMSTITAGSYNICSNEYATLTAAIKAFADGFIMVNAKYTPNDGALAEQYIKTSGVPTSAPDLTWSYASALTAFDARDGTAVESWGAAGLVSPTTCGTGGGATASITFKITATTVVGENIYIVGSVAALQTWNPASAPILSAASYPVWSVTLNIPANTLFEYKYIRKDAAGTVTWASGSNWSYTSPAEGTSVTLNDTWR